MATICNMQHYVSGFRLEYYNPGNAHCLVMAYKVQETTADLSIFVTDGAEALALARKLADDRTWIYTDSEISDELGRENFLAWDARQNAAEAAAAEVDPDLEEEPGDDSADFNGSRTSANSWNGVSDDGN